jgi:hypothetical protein
MGKLGPEAMHDETIMTALAFGTVAVSVAELGRPRKRQNVKIKDAGLAAPLLLAVTMASRR